MDHRVALTVIIAVGLASASLPAMAQFTPPRDPESRIPAPLPPPPQPPVVNGPYQRTPPPGGYQPQRLDTHGDRATRCLHRGAGYGLRGAELDAYVRECAN